MRAKNVFLLIGAVVCVFAVSAAEKPANADKAGARLTREKILVPAADGGFGWSPERLCVETDLNGDAIPDIVISDSISTGGTGGWNWTLWLSTAPNSYERANAEIGAGALAVEPSKDSGARPGSSRLWMYWHTSCASGEIRYLEIGKNGKPRCSPAIEIQPGDRGTDIGRAVCKAIFEGAGALKPRHLFAPAKKD